ncbi:acyl-CoA dehydrogenase family protein [Nonomuraea jabiensis]|uniref:Alkylation response protein AidB-like acyl-CoA dehydrogenase n=1 Tax=Nonomuraea jabiensis TaxID=882448 RepID=A0A7W9GAK8_9ACTN|nr:acyl-CoA dehydrogenase family protein [Nonomuraea jabiensis]MBB5780234.1 alkylation response protein AidB-like acyl-CoA dehydrogenase [Nonomuraea jabiensis]
MTATETTAIADFFDEDLAPIVRRMADRPRAEGGDDDGREIRAMVWEGLAGLGALHASDTVRLAELLGSVLYQGPLLDTLTARELLRDHDLGQAPVALAVADEPWSEQDGAISARRAFVGFAAEVDHFLVGGVDDTAGLRLALVRAGHPSITMRRYEETSRGEAYAVEFAGTPVTAWAGSSAEWQAALANARVRQAAYLVGLAQAALDHAVDYAKTRRQFGQPIGKFQGLAFRLSELSMHIDATRLLVHDRDAAAHAAANLAAASDLARTVTTRTMQVHGAAGMRSDNDAQLYYRRAAAESVRLGTPSQLRRESWGT